MYLFTIFITKIFLYNLLYALQDQNSVFSLVAKIGVLLNLGFWVNQFWHLEVEMWGLFLASHGCSQGAKLNLKYTIALGATNVVNNGKILF